MTVTLLLHAPGHNHHRATISLSSVPPCRHVIRRPCHRATIKNCHLLHHSNVPPTINMPEPCCRETWCYTVTPPCHRDTTVPFCAPLYYRATLCATVQLGLPPYHRAAVQPSDRDHTSAYQCTPTHLTVVNHNY